MATYSSLPEDPQELGGLVQSESQRIVDGFGSVLALVTMENVVCSVIVLVSQRGLQLPFGSNAV